MSYRSCAAYFCVATPARRAVELQASAPAAAGASGRADAYVNDAGAEWLARLWAA